MIGYWLRAWIIRDAANMAIDSLVAKWAEKHTIAVSLKRDAGHWSWRHLRQVKYTWDEAEQKSMAARAYKYLLDNPMSDSEYKALSRINALADQAENMIYGAMIFLSDDDLTRIQPALDRITRNVDNNSDYISDSGPAPE